MRLLLDHPTFIRLDSMITEEARLFELRLLGLFKRQGIFNPDGAAATGARAFAKRLRRQFGVTGRYVAH